jgi:hypothetical protein
MNCLIDYIGLTGCGASSPASGLFINSLPGISFKSIEQLADAEQQTYVGVWNDVQLRATKKLELMLNMELSKNHKVKTAQYSVNTPKSTTDTIVNLGSNAAIKFSQKCVSPLQGHYIQTVTIRKQDIGDDAYLAIYDADTNELLHDETIVTDGSTSVVTFQVHKTFTNENILVTMSVNGGIFYTEDADNIYRDCVYIEYGNTANTFTNTGLNYGLSVVYGLRCSLTNLACYAKDLFALPLWYMLGSEMMMERMTSERINKWTVDRKQAEELKAFYDAEAEKALKAAIAGTAINDCDCCLECDPPIAVREARL